VCKPGSACTVYGRSVGRPIGQSVSHLATCACTELACPVSQTVCVSVCLLGLAGAQCSGAPGDYQYNEWRLFFHSSTGKQASLCLNGRAYVSSCATLTQRTSACATFHEDIILKRSDEG